MLAKGRFNHIYQLNGAEQFDGPKNYEYFGGLVKEKYIFKQSTYEQH